MRQMMNLYVFLFMLFIIFGFLLNELMSKRYQFRPKDAVNATRWKKRLYQKALDKITIAKKIKNPFPRIPKTRPQRVIKKLDTKQHNPCRVVKDICLNGGICRSLGEDWYCDCPQTHYGKSCEFLASQLHCTGNLCQNNSTCYSIKTIESVPNPNVTAVRSCSKEMMHDNQFHKQCNFTLNLQYKCWCRFGYEGSFCEFTEGMRCCAEDHCNHHGLIEHNISTFQNMKFDEAAKNMSCDSVNCTCHCEEYYSQKDNCLTIDPCRDHECFNGGQCSTSPETKIPKCKCPSRSEFFAPDDIGIEGENCDTIVTPDNPPDEDLACTPCTEGSGFKTYLECMQKKLDANTEIQTLQLPVKIEMSHLFANDCIVAGQHVECREALTDKYCLNSGSCAISVSNISTILPLSASEGTFQLKRPFFLVPKCECLPNFEGDFCENHVLDECDRKDLEEHSLSNTNINLTINATVFQSIKNRILGWQPAYSSSKGKVATVAFERMKTYCGNHGLCRPFDDEQGMDCKCDHGFKGARCEVKDPCAGDPCREMDASLCVDIPIMDDDSPQSSTNSTFACICDTSQTIDSKTQKCMEEHSEVYEQYCYKDGQPICKHKGSCYPCKLDNKMMDETNVQQRPLGLCNAEEAKRTFRCICPPGFEPPTCEREATACDFHRCQNGAECEPLPEDPFNYRCICLPGYGPQTNNTLCQLIEDICLIGASACKNGTCAPDSKWRRGFRCDCKPGYYGLNCEFVEQQDFMAYINDNYNWTYALILFSALLPIFLAISAIKDGYCASLIQLCRFKKREGKGYKRLERSLIRDDESDEDPTQESTSTAKLA